MASKAAAAASAHFLQFRIQYSSIAFLYYDYALTFPTEVKYMWGRKFRFTTFLYILCRYALVANVLYVFAKTNKLGSSCDAILKFIGVISCFGRAAVIATLTMRTYAVYGCNRFILVFFVSMGITCFVLDFLDVPGSKCVGSSGGNEDAATALSIMMVIFESLAAIMLTLRSISEFHIGKTWRIERGSFFTLVFRQGAIYFAFVSVFTTAAVILNFRAPSGSFFQRLPNAYTLPLSCTLIARFLLQLRQWQERSFIAMDDGGQALSMQEQNRETLTELRATAIIDSIILSDFGNGSGSGFASSRVWESETNQTLDRDAEAQEVQHEKKPDAIPLHEIRVDGGGEDTTRARADEGEA